MGPVKFSARNFRQDAHRKDAEIRRALMMLSKPPEAGVDRFVEEQMFEEDLRAVMLMLRPHRNERLAGWQEYRTGGTQFRATISWDPEFEKESGDDSLAIPKMADVLEAILVGSAKAQDELTAEEEFGAYKRVVRELYRRLNELESRYH